MAIPNTETLLPLRLSEYVHSRRADLGLPNESVLPFVVGPTLEEQNCPRVLFMTSAGTSSHPRRQTLTVTVELQTNAEQQDIEIENGWTAGLRYALADKAGFLAWMADLDEAERTGFDLKKYRTVDSGMAVDDTKKLRGRRTDVEMIVRSDEMAPPVPEVEI